MTGYDTLSRPLLVTATDNSTTTYTYLDLETRVMDANGNMVTRVVGGSTYNLSYDAENRLVGVSGAASATFVYDGDGKRVKATVGGTTTVYIGNYSEWTGSISTLCSVASHLLS